MHPVYKGKQSKIRFHPYLINMTSESQYTTKPSIANHFAHSNTLKKNKLSVLLVPTPLYQLKKSNNLNWEIYP